MIGLSALVGAARGYRVLYRTGAICPGCGHSQWHVGRVSAECAVCCTALPVAPAAQPPVRQ